VKSGVPPIWLTPHKGGEIVLREMERFARDVLPRLDNSGAAATPEVGLSK